MEWSGDDPAVDSLSQPIVDRTQFPFVHESAELEELVRNDISAELSARLLGDSPPPED